MKSNKYFKTIKKLSVFIFAVVSLTVMLIVSSAAAKLDEFTVTAYSEGNVKQEISMEYQYSDATYYLILPSNTDLSNLVVNFEASKDVYVNTTKLTSGEATDVFKKEGKYMLSCGARIYNLEVVKTDLPAIMINTESGSMDKVHADKEYKEPGNIAIVNGGETLYNGVLTSIKGRGNATWNESKKPYNIKLDKKTDLFGMGKAKGWCLLANHSDLTLIRNQWVYNLAQEIGLENTSKMVQVDLFIDGVYYGVYCLTEKVEIGDNRIEINDLQGATEKANKKIDIEECERKGDLSLNPGAYKYIDIPKNPEDITGGYLLEVELSDRYLAELCGFVTNRGVCVVIKEPEYASKAQVEYIKDYFQQFEDALYSSTGYNEQGSHYSELCNMESLVKTFIVNDIAVNLDTGITSCYFYKDTGDTLYSGPIWDMDQSLANNSERLGFNLKDPETEYVSKGVYLDNTNLYHIFSTAYSHKDFEEAVNLCYKTTVVPIKDKLIDEIQTYADNVEHDMLLNAVVTDAFSDTTDDITKLIYKNKVIEVKKFAQARLDYLEEYYAADYTERITAEEQMELNENFFTKIKNFFQKLFKDFIRLFKYM